METVKTKIMMMNFITEDLLAVILSRLPLKCIATCKLVCKQWKSIAESRFLRELFLSRHQNSHASWSVMYRDKPDRDAPEEVMAHYGCEVWGLQRSLGSYVSSFIKGMRTKKKQKVRVLAYTDVGLILISSGDDLASYYVANPISRQYVKIPPLPHLPTDKKFRPLGLVTRIENGVLLSYKVVLMDTSINEDIVLGLLIYSSETCLWSLKTLHPSRPLRSGAWPNPLSLSGNLHWLGSTLDSKNAVVSHDFYATGTDSDRCRVTIIPDVVSLVNVETVCPTSQGFLMYTNIFEEDKEDRLRAYRLKSGEWEQVSQISPAIFKTGFEYFILLAMNPFDGDTLYLWSRKRKCFVSINLYNKDKFGLHNNLERTSDGLTLSFTSEWATTEEGLYDSNFSTFVLPRWLYRIPSSPSGSTSLAGKLKPWSRIYKNTILPFIQCVLTR